MKEHKVGDRFTVRINGREVMLEVVPYGGCEGCYFNGDDVCQLDENHLVAVVDYCSRTRREDKTSVIFKEVPPAIEDTANGVVADVLGNVDYAYFIAHRTEEGEISIKTIGKPENIGKLKESLKKMLEEEK